MNEPHCELAVAEPQKSHLELNESFRDHDSNDDGRIDFVEFACLAANIHARLSHAHLIEGFRQMDSNRDGFIDFHEFLLWWRARDVG
jgi:Ca2+-binding EF-hand superfamily protein